MKYKIDIEVECDEEIDETILDGCWLNNNLFQEQ